jgi:hypothetical protein
MLVLQIRVFSDAYQWTSPGIEIFDHELSEAVVGVIHFVVEEKSEVERFPDVRDEVINSIGVDVAQNTLAIE